MSKLNFKWCRVEHAVFYKYKGQDILLVAADVDDMTIVGNSKQAIRKLKDGLSQHVKIKDLGDLSWMLEIEVTRDRLARTVSFLQRSYIVKILERFNLQNASLLSTPLNPHHKLTLAQCPDTPRHYEAMRGVLYREAIGLLMYTALGTWPDIMFAVSFLSQFMQNPGRPHWEEVKRVFRYLKGTIDLKLTIGGGDHWSWAEDGLKKRIGLEGFTDADGASQHHRHSILGYVFTIDGGAVSWSSKKQSIVALSTTEAEYIAATHTAKEALWICMFLAEITRPLSHPTTLYCDNQSAISISKNDQSQTTISQRFSHGPTGWKAAKKQSCRHKEHS
jgi:Reverse transcriptase (RNA-dependent DNA polymerase)